MLILDEYIDTWNYTFIIVALVALGIGTFLAIRNIKKQELKSRRDKRSNTEESSNKSS
jgi:F0F1-type ATP synthase assembly protein I